MKSPTPLAFVDIETTGGSATIDRIIEIGVLRVEEGVITQTMKTLVNPHTYLPAFITEMTGIEPSDLQEAPSFRDIMQELYEILEGSIFVAHNARFDYGFIKNEFKRHNYTFTAKVLDTVRLSRLLFPQHSRHNLDTIIERFAIACESRHRAFDDAKVLWDFYQLLHRDYTDLPIQSTIDRLIKQPSLPPHLAHQSLDDLPESPGVYIFHGDTELPLYIGKSTSLRDRILSHFSGDHTSQTEMMISQQVRDIETIRTAGELGALILEARLIKERKPFYNRRLRSMQAPVLVKQALDKKGYATIKMVETTAIEVEDLPDIIHVASSKQAAKSFLQGICEKHGLCKRILGLERGNSSCFDYKLGKCAGACAGKQSVDLHNASFILAFDCVRIQPWPFSGPILLRETNPESGATDLFLFDNWCYLATLHEEEIQEVKETSYEYQFDLDTYKILKKFLDKKRVNTILEVVPLPNQTFLRQEF